MFLIKNDKQIMIIQCQSYNALYASCSIPPFQEDLKAFWNNDFGLTIPMMSPGISMSPSQWDNDEFEIPESRQSNDLCYTCINTNGAIVGLMRNQEKSAPNQITKNHVNYVYCFDNINDPSLCVMSFERGFTAYIYLHITDYANPKLAKLPMIERIIDGIRARLSTTSQIYIHTLDIQAVRDHGIEKVINEKMWDFQIVDNRDFVLYNDPSQLETISFSALND